MENTETNDGQKLGKKQTLKLHKKQQREFQKTTQQLLKKIKNKKERQTFLQNRQKEYDDLIEIQEKEIRDLERILDIDMDKYAEEQKEKKKLENLQKKKLKEIKEEQKKLEVAKEASQLVNQKDLETKKMIKRLEKDGLKIVNVKADGHCLFRALGDQMNYVYGQDIGSVEEIRKKFANILRENRDEYEAFLEIPFDEYCDRLENTNEWGGQIELRLCSELFKVPVTIFQADNDPIYIGHESFGDKKDLMVSFHRHYYALGEHYNSVHKLSSDEQ